MSQREVLKDGSVRLWDERCSFFYARPRPGVVLVTISGSDEGQFGLEPLEEMGADLQRYPPVELFIDTQQAMGANLRMQEAWTEWFARNRAALKSVSILVRSKYMHLTVEMARFFSRTGELIRVYLDPAPFEEALSRVTGVGR